MRILRPQVIAIACTVLAIHGGGIQAQDRRGSESEFEVHAGDATTSDAALEPLRPGSLTLPRFKVDVGLRIGGKGIEPSAVAEDMVEYADIPAGLPLNIDFTVPMAMDCFLPSRQVLLNEGERVALEIPTGNIELALPGDSRVAVVSAGKRVELNPESIIGLPIGRYLFDAGGPGYSNMAEALWVQEGRTLKWEAWTTGAIAVSLTPPDARIRVPDLAVAELAALPPGRHLIIAEKESHRSASAEIVVERGKTIPLDLQLVPLIVEFIGLPEEASVFVNGESAEIRRQGANAQLTKLPPGTIARLKIADSRAASLDPESSIFEIILGDDESRIVRVATGTFVIPFLPRGSRLFLGSGSGEREIFSSMESDTTHYESVGLVPGKYLVSIKGPRPYSGVAAIRGGAKTMPDLYRETLMASLSDAKAKMQVRSVRTPMRKTLGWISLAAGVLGAAGAGATYYLGGEAKAAYEAAPTTSEAEKTYKKVELYQVLFPAAIAAGSLGLVLSPLLLAGSDPREIQRSIDDLDRQIKAMQGEE